MLKLESFDAKFSESATAKAAGDSRVRKLLAAAQNELKAEEQAARSELKAVGLGFA